MRKHWRFGIAAVLLTGVVATVDFYLNIISVAEAVSIIFGMEISTMTAFISIFLTLITIYLVWQRLKFSREKHSREENKKKPDIHVEEWYPQDDEIRINLSNIAEDRAKNLGLLIIAKPWRQYIGPLGGPNVRDFKPSVKKNTTPLRRTDGRVGKNVDNYLQGEEMDIPFKASANVQIVDDELETFSKISHPFQSFIEDLSSEIKALTLQVVLTYDNAHNETMEPIRIATFTTTLDHPDHVLRRQEAAPAETEFGTRIIVHPDSFEEVFKTPNISWHGGLGESVFPSTNIGFFSIGPTDLEKVREKDEL